MPAGKQIKASNHFISPSQIIREPFGFRMIYWYFEIPEISRVFRTPQGKSSDTIIDR